MPLGKLGHHSEHWDSMHLGKGVGHCRSMVDTVVVGTCSPGLGSIISWPALCPSGHREVNYGCFLSDCAFEGREGDFQAPVPPGCLCWSSSSSVFGKPHICISGF